MNIKKAIVVLLVFFGITGIIFEVIYFRTPFWIKASSIPDIFEITYILKKILEVLSIVLTFIGVIKLIKIKKIELLSIFKFSIFFIFLENFFRLIQSILSSEIPFFLFENAPWFLYPIRFLSILLLGLVIFHYSKINQGSNGENKPSTMASRFINRTLDISIILIFGLDTIKVLSNTNNFKMHSFTELNSSISFLVISFFYYFIFEVLFLQTIGKLHNNSIVEYKGYRPVAILVRTMCRFIPFDAFSFLGRKDWHDSVSKTKVTIANNSNRRTTP